MKDMMNINKKIDLGLPPWYRNKIDASPFAAMASSALPLLPTSAGSYQLWKKPYFMNHGDDQGANSGGTKTYLKPSDDNYMAPVSLEDNDMMTQNQSQSFDHKDMISGGDGGVATATYQGLSPFDSDDQPVKDVQIRWGRNLDPNMDPKKMKRILSNRLSAQKSRLKKLQYISDLERHVKALEDEISVLSPKVVFHQNHQKLLKMENTFLNQKITICADSIILIEAQIEEHKAEVNRLKQLLTQSQQQQIQGQTRMNGWESGLNQMANLSVNQSGPEQMINMNSNLQCDGMEQMMNFNSLNLNGFI